MRLSLLVPDLLWGRADNTPLFNTLGSLPGAALLAARAPTAVAYRSAEAILAASCGLGDGAGGIDLAALRHRGESGQKAAVEPGRANRILCADPVHFRFHQEFLIAADDSQIGLSATEVDQLISALNQHFAERARFSAATPSRWYVELAEPPAGSWPPLAEIVGRSLAPRLFEPAALQQLGSEAQMLLYAHPVNRAREDAGRPGANGVWLWGGIDNDPDTSRTASIPNRLVGHGPLLRGVADAIGATLATEPASAMNAGTGSRPEDSATLVLVDSLRTAASYESIEDYERAWQDFSTRCLEPSIARWRAGEYAAVEVIAPCTSYGTLIWRWDERPGLLDRLRNTLRWQRDTAGLQDLARALAAGADK